MREEQFPSKLKMNLTSVLCQSLQKLVGQGLSSELADQPFIIDFALHFPWSDNHLVLVFIRQLFDASDCDSSITFLKNILNLVRTTNPAHQSKT